MAQAREVLPGRMYMVTRRCLERCLLLRPDDATNEAFLYCLGVAADYASVDLLFTLANSNHHHTGIYDPLGTYPKFLEHFHKLLARCINAIRGRNECVFSPEQANVVRLVEPEDALDKMIYALTNPVKDHLVQHAYQWPGASSLAASRDGTTLVVHRPRYFRVDGEMPETVTLRFRRPLGFEDWTPDEWAAEIDRRVEIVEARVAADLRLRGRHVLGRARVLRQAWSTRPTTREARGGLVPRIAAASRWARAEALQRSKAFQLAYRRAREAFMLGEAPIRFPPGTYFHNKPKILSAAWFAKDTSGSAAA